MNNIAYYRKSRGWSQQKFSEKINVGRSTISMWEISASEPSFEQIILMSELFNITPEELMNTPKKIHTKLNNTHIPIYGTIPAGVPTEMIESEYIEDYEDIPPSMLAGDKQYFGLKVKGDSMLPEFQNDDTLILLKQNDCASGECCAVSINCTECTFKKVIKTGNGIMLQPLNPNYEPLYFDNKQIENLPITILGIVVEVRRTINGGKL